jgi:hypothetical protein
MNEQLRQPVREVVELLAAGKYAELEMLTRRQRLSAQEMAKAISDYGRKLVLPPDDAFALIDVVEVRNARPPQWSVTMPLWTREEGRSDLSIAITVIADGEGFRIELDDIHVL